MMKMSLIFSKAMLNKTFHTFEKNDKEFSINLTIHDILNESITSHINTLLKQYDIGPRVVFEIVESESIEKFNEVLGFILYVKKFGCKIAIDDFGTGYSNFAYLIELKADYIKIDGSLIKQLETNKDTQALIETIVSFAKKMNMKTIAEFVETEELFLKVKELQIDYSQGYYFSEPKTQLDA